MKCGINNRGNFPAFFLFSIGLTYLFLFGTSPVWATDLGTTLTVNMPKCSVGDRFIITAEVDNTSTRGGGPYKSPGTILRILLDEKVQYVSSEAPNGAPGTVDMNKQEVIFDLGDVEAGLKVDATVVAEAKESGGCTIFAEVWGDLFDPYRWNNEDSCFFEITEPPPRCAAPLIIDDFLNYILPIEVLDQDGTFPVSIGTTVEGSMLGGELDAVLALDGVENSGDGAYFTVEQGRTIFTQDATSTGRVLLIWDGVDGDAFQVVASTGLGGGVDLTKDGTLDGIEIDVARNDLPLKVALIVFSGADKTSELTLDIPVTDSLVAFRYPFSDLTSQGESADLTRVTTVIMLVGAQGSAVGPVHIEIDSIKVTSSQGPGRCVFQEPPSKATSYVIPYEPCPPCPESEGVGDPIYAFSGEYYTSLVDLRIAGRGLDFVWARKYRSRIGPNTAQGNGWDFSYNIRIERDDVNIVLFDGNTRQDQYLPQPNGTWAADGFFQEFTQDNPSDPDSSFTLTFSDTSTWHFHRFDHAQAPGRISATKDRNGNTISFDYDTQGRLVTVHDTLDTEAHNRDITIAYNQDGFIESVTDFIGRQVRYAYYQDGDNGGSFGDLKSVTKPAVTGTPTGNDFPQGKTTAYTYSKGFADERLNHNLLTITDPKGQTYLTNIYAPTENPQDLNFDRIVCQIWGDPVDILDLTYVRQVPSEQNDFAVIKAIVNDRMGNVQEYFFDSDNQRVVQRAYTGRADPNQPTTETQNRPTGKLRPDDPDFFEIRWIYNADSLVSQIVYPNGNFTMNLYETDLNPSAPRRSRGNLREVHHLPGPLESLSSQSTIIESYEYDTDLGGCCGTNFVTREVDGRGNETLHEYDDRGNRIRTQHRIHSIVEEWEYNEFGQMTKHTLPDNGSGHRREDVYTYYSDPSDPQNGYLKSVIIDAANLALTTTYEHDAVGNLTSETDPRGHDVHYIYNQLDQVVRRISRPVTSPNGVRYERDTYYDKNDNVVRVDIQNIDDQGVLQANTHFTTIYEYDSLNYLIRQSTEVGNYMGAIPGPPELPSTTGLPETEFITTEYEYDANRNRTLVRYGEATEGRQPTNVVHTLYDARDLVFKQISADGDPDQSTTQYNYDGNGNVNRILQGLEDNPRITVITCDGYNRLVASIDPMGNSVTFGYDENSNQISQRYDGELIDIPDGTDNVRLSEMTYIYDAMDRPIRTEVAFFDSQTQEPIDDGLSFTEAEYSDTSRIIRITNDNNHATETTYDTANRIFTDTDAKGNTLTYNYDENSNLISATTVEKSDLGAPDETFTTTFTYDGLDRLTQSVDNVGNTLTYAYDSRDNQTHMIDALAHETHFVYDGINRLIQTIRDLDYDGADGDGDDVTTGQTWDDTSRLTERIDDNGNTTSYAYDALDRWIRTTYADGTQHNATYDVHNNQLTLIDGNGSVATATYDLLDRLTNKTITPGAGVSDDTTFESYAYDGLSRIVRAEDDDSVVILTYDSLSNVTNEILNGQTIACVYDGVGNKVSCTYPGGRQIHCVFDELDRQRVVSDDSGTIATYSYVGLDRVERREYGNSTRTDYMYDGITGIPNPLGDFGVKQVIGTRHTQIASGTIIDNRTYKWDPMYNKVQRRDIRVSGPELTHDYQYDSIYRLVHTTVTDAGIALVRDEVYQLDGVGNRTQVSGGTNPGTYTMDPTKPVSADFQMNQYTTTPSDMRVYDENGNLITIDDGLSTPQNFSFDYCNQLVECIGSQRHTYAYDVFGRRIARVVDVDGAPQETRYFYDGWQVCEEQDASGATQATYVYGLYIDEVLNMRRGGQDFYYHADDLYNIMAVTDSTGAVRERYEYTDYGSLINPTTLTPVEGNASALSNPYLFQGRRYDSETGFYYFRNRYYDPETGRFLQRDPAWDPGNVGNQYTFVGNGPISEIDPLGLRRPTEKELQSQLRRQSVKYDKRKEQMKRQDELIKHLEDQKKALEAGTVLPFPSTNLYMNVYKCTYAVFKKIAKEQAINFVEQALSTERFTRGLYSKEIDEILQKMNKIVDKLKETEDRNKRIAQRGRELAHQKFLKTPARCYAVTTRVIDREGDELEKKKYRQERQRKFNERLRRLGLDPDKFGRERQRDLNQPAQPPKKKLKLEYRRKHGIVIVD